MNIYQETLAAMTALKSLGCSKERVNEILDWLPKLEVAQVSSNDIMTLLKIATTGRVTTEDILRLGNGRGVHISNAAGGDAMEKLAKLQEYVDQLDGQPWSWVDGHRRKLQEILYGAEAEPSEPTYRERMAQAVEDIDSIRRGFTPTPSDHGCGMHCEGFETGVAPTPSDGEREALSSIVHGLRIEEFQRGGIKADEEFVDTILAHGFRLALSTPSEGEQLSRPVPGHAGCEQVLVDGESWFDHHPAPVDREKLAIAIREALTGQRAWSPMHTADLAADAVAKYLAVPPAPARDAREVLHAKCDCVPDLGPAHCHLCGEAKGSPVEWSQCEAVVPARDEWEYQVEWSSLGTRTFTAGPMETYEDAHGFVLENIHGGSISRRTKGIPAGPWLPVTEEER